MAGFNRATGMRAGGAGMREVVSGSDSVAAWISSISTSARISTLDLNVDSTASRLAPSSRRRSVAATSSNGAMRDSR
ncbi:MAG: hypothetical protein PHW08_14105 [Kiritimatiellae bacterium]|nr:hypothetical protein [Kiritimatiellia bacterium]